MKKIFKGLIQISLTAISLTVQAQDLNKSSSDFWKKVQFGGGIGLNIGSGFTNISLAPSAIYKVNEIISIGAGLQGSYVSAPNLYQSIIYGGTITGLINASEVLQFSIDLDQLKVNTTFDQRLNQPSKHFWNTAMFIGAGYRTGNITVGAKYNLLHNKENLVYNDAFMPFARVYF